MDLIKSIVELPGSQLPELAVATLTLVLVAIFATRLIMRSLHDFDVRGRDARIWHLEKTLLELRSQNRAFSLMNATLAKAVADLTGDNAAAHAEGWKETTRRAVEEAEVRKSANRQDFLMLKTFVGRYVRRSELIQ